MSLLDWLVAAAAALFVVLLAILPFYWRLRRVRAEIARARVLFHQQREWLEARFLTIAGKSGKPRGLNWADCEFEDAVAFARDRKSGNLRALVGVTIRFEAPPGGELERLDAINDWRAATAVFFYSDGKWTTDGRAVFNLNPAQTIRRYQHELKTVD